MTQPDGPPPPATPGREERLRRLRTLTEVSRALTYARSLEDVLSLAVERAAQLVSAERTLIMLADEGGLLRVRAAWGIRPERLDRFREPLSEALVRQLQDLLDYPDEECFVSVPLIVQGAVTGLLAAVRSSAAGPGSLDDEWLLSALGDQVAVAVEHARLLGAVEEERERAVRTSETHGRSQATLGHELRSPLMAIEGYSSLLLDGLYGPLTDPQRESVARIRLSGQHLLSVIESVLDAGRLDMNAMSLALAEVRLARVVEEAVHMVRPAILEKEQKLEVRIPEDVSVRADANRLRQTFVNLLDNASKYTGRGGRIVVRGEVSERASGRWAVASVVDDGRGISGEALETLFGPYQRGDGHGHEGGLGLGLYISRELARRMGGEIEVETELGTGSTFRVLLPLSEERNGSATAPPPSA